MTLLLGLGLFGLGVLVGAGLMARLLFDRPECEVCAVLGRAAHLRSAPTE